MSTWGWVGSWPEGGACGPGFLASNGEPGHTSGSCYRGTSCSQQSVGQLCSVGQECRGEESLELGEGGGVSDPGLSPGHSRFVLSPGPLGSRVPGGGRGGLGWTLSPGWGARLRLGPLGRTPAFSSPHPCRMILSVLTGLLFGSDGYYVALAWTSSALMYFLVSLGCPLVPCVGAGDKPPPTPAQRQLSVLPGTLFANSSPGPRQHGGPGSQAASPALPDSGCCSLPAPHHILADLPPGPVTPSPHWY